MTKYRTVTPEEYDAFIASYPRALIVDCCGISEPPTLSHNDQTLGNWPDSAVASCKVDDYLATDNFRIDRFGRKETGWRILK